jgi:hypothetical protein
MSRSHALFESTWDDEGVNRPSVGKNTTILIFVRYLGDSMRMCPCNNLIAVVTVYPQLLQGAARQPDPRQDT